MPSQQLPSWMCEVRQSDGRGKVANQDAGHAVFRFPLFVLSHISRVSDQDIVPSQSEMAEIKEMLKKQQEQMNQLSTHLLQLQNSPRWSQPPNNGPVISRRCQQPGHFARNCENERVAFQQQRPQSRPMQRSAVQNPPSEN